MKAEKKQTFLFLAFAIAMVATFIWSYQTVKKADFTEIVTGQIVAKSDDTVKSGRHSQRSRFAFAMRYDERPSDTIEVELHTFVTKKVGDRYSYYLRHSEDNGLILAALFLSGYFTIGFPLLMAGKYSWAWFNKDN